MDHYNTLGVLQTATDEEIKKNYRKLAMQFHPDRNPGDKEAELKFKEVQQAYDTLSDPQKRLRYDQTNRAGHLSHYSSPPPQPKPAPKPKTKEDFEKNRTWEERKKNPNKQDLDSIHCTFFNGNGTGRNIMVQMKLTPAEMANGGSKFVSIKKRTLCERCIGDGKAPTSCPACRGLRSDVAYCQRCDGMGAIPATCTKCNGEGVFTWIIEDVKVVFSPRIQPGHQIKVVGHGEYAPFKPPGSVRVVVIS